MTYINLKIHPITDANFDIEVLAEALAASDCDAQSLFFNEFEARLRKRCDIAKGSMGISMQCLWINRKLSTDAKYFFESLGSI